MAETMAVNADEQELLRQYVEQGDGRAFLQLVEAHKDMVFSVCRRILRNGADAEDAAQDSFLQLARKAGALKAPIAGWLHQVALHAALDQRERNARREGRETMAAKMRSTVSDPHWEDLQGIVDEAISALPGRLRVAVVLHYLEGRTQQEVAAQLRISQPAVSKQLAQGVAVLQKRLKRAGILVPCAALAVLLTSHAVEAAPATLSTALGKIAFTGLAAGAKIVGAKALTIGGMSVFKASIVSVVAASVLVTGGVIVHRALAQNPASPTPAPVVAAAPAPAPVPVAIAAEKVILRKLYTPGNYITVNETDGEQRIIMDSVDMPQHVTQTFTTLTQVGEPDAQGSKTLTISYKSVRIAVKQAAMEMAFDSDKPDDENPAAKTWSSMFRPMIGAKITAVIDPEGNVKEVKGFDEIWDEIIKKNPATAQIAKMMKEQMSDQYIETMIDAGAKALPANPVAVGEEWVADSTITVPFLGEIKYLQRNTLEKLTDTPQGRVATIVFGGQMTQSKEQPVDFGPAKATFKKLDMEQAGELEFNIDSGIAVKSETHIEGDMQMVMVMPAPQGAQPGQEPQAPKTMNMTMKQLMTTKATTREATEEDLKPRAAVSQAPIADEQWIRESRAALGAIRTQENVFKTEKDVFLAVAAGDLANEPMAARPGLGLDLSKNIYFDANCLSVALDATYGFVATCDGTAANNAAPRKADVKTCIIQERGNGESRSSVDSGATFTAWK